MSDIASPPRAIEPLIDFVAILRANGFAVAPEQTAAFLSAIVLLGPRDLEDIRRAGLATLAPPPERHAAYHALFDMHFLGAEGHDLPEGEEEDVVRVQEDRRGFDESISTEESNESGQAATRAEALVERRFGPAGAGEALRRLSREASRRLPKRLSYRRWRARRGAVVDLRRTLREATRNDGEVIKLSHVKRRTRPRKLLLLIDVSGSMKARTEDNLRLAHALTQAIPRVEAFTFGTRLTRITRPMRLKRREQALAVAAQIVSDWDGGTRIGDALKAFLAVPRFASYARGAVVLIVSDGLERGDPAALADAVARLSRSAWRLSWLTPLATGRDFRPRTEALVAIFPFIDDMVDGGSTPAIVNHLLELGAQESRVIPVVDGHHHIWRQADLPWLAGPMQPRIFGPYEPIRRDYPIEEFRADIAGSDVVRSVYVQTNWAPGAYEDEAAWVQRTADRTGWPHAIVAYADFSAEDVRPQLDRLSRYPLVRGARMQLHWHENPQYRFAARRDLPADPRIGRNIGRLADYGWTFDLQVFAPQMADAAALAESCPKVAFVLQHAGMLEDLSPAGRAEWRAGMVRLAACPNVVAKLSGLGTFLHRNDPGHIAHVVGETVRIFGAGRCLFGSNFPVEKLWTSYGALIEACRDAVRRFTPKEQQAILHDTAMSVYRIAA